MFSFSVVAKRWGEGFRDSPLEFRVCLRFINALGISTDSLEVGAQVSSFDSASHPGLSSDLYPARAPQSAP